MTQGTPAPLRRHLPGHDVETAFERGSSTLQNGELIAVAQRAGFDVFVTGDKNLKYQQNLDNRTLAIVVILSTSWPRIQLVVSAVASAVAAATPSSYQEVTVPGAA